MFSKHKFRKLYLALFILFIVFCSGVIGFMYIDDYNFREAFYMTVITLSTVGFKEVKPLSPEGMYFTAFLIVFSLATFAFSVRVITSFLIDGDFQKQLKRIKQLKKIKEKENHVIICGYGRNGKQIAEDINLSGQDFIVIEKDELIVKENQREGEYHFLHGDATSDQVLQNAGINKAKVLVAALPEDTDNLFIVLTAREMNKKLLIISRASKDSTDKKLRLAGANNVVMPDKVGGTHMASLVLKPDVVEFFNHLRGQDNDVFLEEIIYEDIPDELRGGSLGELKIKERSGLNVIGYKNKGGEYLINPDEDTKLDDDAKIFVLGTKNQLNQLKKWE